MVVGKILGVAGRILAKKFLSKKLGKAGKSAFLKRRKVLGTTGPHGADIITKKKIG